MMNIKQEPRIAFKDLFAGLFFFLGLILFITVLHILTIESVGNVSSVLSTTFAVFLYVIGFLLLITMSYVIIHLLRWLAWTITTPEWKQKQFKKKDSLKNV